GLSELHPEIQSCWKFLDLWGCVYDLLFRERRTLYMTGQTTKQTSSSFPAKASGFLHRAGTRLRFLRWRGRRLWKVPGGYRITPALAGSIIFTLASLTVTAVSWALVRLLPNRELMDRLIADLPRSLLEI